MKKAMLFVSFGSSYESARLNNIDKTVNFVKHFFDDYDTFQAYTSNIIRKKLANQGIIIESVPSALEKIKSMGYENVIIVSFHIIAGFEYGKIIETVNKFDFKSCKITNPMLNDEQDYIIVAKILDNIYEDLKNPIILMGHGSEHKNDLSYEKLQSALDEIKKDKFYIATVEGQITINDIIPKLKNIKDVYVTPFMIVCGDHANNDMAGDDDESWVNILKNENINAVPILKGLGEYEEISQYFVEKVKEVI